MTCAFYPGSFDPMTNGHLDILKQAMAVFDDIVVGIGVHPGKVPMFSFEERARLIADCAGGASGAGLRVVAFDQLAVDAAVAAEASVIVRGLRDGSDLDYEMQMSGMNGVMRPDVTTVFFPASPATRPITATLVRQIARMGGDVSAFVPANVAEAIRGKTA
ncbi:pantetheine-phosphate adenylyltransferase [Aurantimonas sp. A2-1-M11]|uniref:pantetheine-phosphate adenylyltransferase n=1 Tax=Aurantimonas sp. A2-1-M11 TaxID=3113712 RepID=UPI002F92F01D